MEFKMITPAARPKMKRKELVDLIKSTYPDYTIPEILVVGIRGYYRDTMGQPGVNDIGIYDDAIFILTRNSIFPFNANSDPSSIIKGIATLNPGIWESYMFGLHRGQYLALCQRAGLVTVSRSGAGNDTGYFGINIHRGGNWKTNSAGCQTIAPAQWNDFINTMQIESKKLFGSKYREQAYTYLLMLNPEAGANQDS